MTQRRLLLLSNSKNYGMGFLEHAVSSIQNFLGEGIKRVLFIPYAGVTMTFDEMTGRVGEQFNKMGYELDSVHTSSNPVEAIENAQAIAVSGGNTFHLLSHLYDNKLIDPLRGRVMTGTPYIGWSAGSNVAGPTIKTTNDMPIVQPHSFDALGVVPFQINPHYLDVHPEEHQGETREQRLEEFIATNSDIYGVGLREGCMLRVENNELALLGRKKTMRVFRRGEAAREVGSTENLSFLLEG